MAESSRKCVFSWRVCKLCFVLCYLSALPGTVRCQLPGSVIPLSSEDIEELVDTHNLLRGSVDPPASNMQTLVWNEELAAAAQNFSLNCRQASNTNRASQVRGFATVGENWTAVGTRGQPNYTLILNNAWFSQRVRYNFTANSCTTTDACSFYTQMVWAETTAVGCGAARCLRIPLFPVTNSVLFICYYGPEGNTPGVRPYLTGTPCSSCPENQNICTENLCTNSSILSTTVPTTTTTTTTTTTAATTATTATTQPTPTNPPSPFPATTTGGDDDDDGDNDTTGVSSRRRSGSQLLSGRRNRPGRGSRRRDSRRRRRGSRDGNTDGTMSSSGRSRTTSRDGTEMGTNKEAETGAE